MRTRGCVTSKEQERSQRRPRTALNSGGQGRKGEKPWEQVRATTESGQEGTSMTVGMVWSGPQFQYWR